MSEPTTNFDARQALARLSEAARSAAARSGGKGKRLKPEDQQQVVQALVDLLVRSTLPLADIAQGVQDVPARLYAAAFGETWGKMTSERIKDALQWIEGLPKEAANSVRRSLIPMIAEHDPKSGRTMLPAKPKDLDSGEERERLAKNWLGQDASLLANLLAGDLVEYEVTRVLRLFLRLANEPGVNSRVRSEVVRLAARGLSEHQLAGAKTGIDPILQALAEIIRTLPGAEAASVNEFFREYTPQVASRLGLAIPAPVSPATTTPEVAASSVNTESQPAVVETDAVIDEEGIRPQLAGTVPPAVVAVKRASPNVTGRKPDHITAAFEGPTQESTPSEVVLALQAQAKEYRDSALLLETAASALRAAAETVVSLRAQTIAQGAQLLALEDRVESLSNDLQGKQDQLRAKTKDLRDRDASIQNLTRSSAELSSRLAEASAATSRLQTLLDSETSEHKQQMDLLVQRMSGETNQRLEEFRNDVARRVSEVLRGTPPLDSGDGAIDGRAILFRVWEIIEALKRKSIPIRLG